MAEPFGIGTGIVGVISLAIQITQVVRQFGMDWKEAPEKIRTFMAELGTLKTVLSETNTNIILNPDFANAFQNRPSSMLSQLGLQAPTTTDTNLMLEICGKNLDSMLKELKKQVQGNRIGWERLRGAFLVKDTLHSVKNVYRQCQTLNSMLSIDMAVLGATTYIEVRDTRKEQRQWHEAEVETSLAIRDGVDEFNQRHKSQEQEYERQTILDWLTHIDYATQQNDSIGRRQAGTGQWLLDSNEFQTWLDTNQEILFCPGFPGVGKTILTSIVIQDVTKRFFNDPTVGIAYVYFNFRRQNEQKIEDLLASLLKQLAKNQQSLPGTVKDLYYQHNNQHKTRETRPSLDEIFQCLSTVTTLYSRVFIIVDALDECQVFDGCRQRFLSHLFRLKANIFATSRTSNVEKDFDGEPMLEIRASEGDVRTYLEGHMDLLPKFAQRPELQEEIKTSIVKAVDGMFLLAKLYLESLTGKSTPKAIRTALKNFATGSGAYDHAYQDAMERIRGQTKDQADLATKVLYWITCAKRSLTTVELQLALAVEIGSSQLDDDNIPEVEEIVSVCAGLVTYDAESGIIRLVHYTTQEYFERTQSYWFPEAEREMTRICVSYLAFDKFQSGGCQDIAAFNQRVQSNKLYHYAAQNWGHHARKHSKLISEVTRFLEMEAQVDASSQVLLPDIRLLAWIVSQNNPNNISSLHISAYFGLLATISDLLDRSSPDTRDILHRTPLSYAAEYGHRDVVQLLLMHQTDVDSKDNKNRTPLLFAAKNGHRDVVQLLLIRQINVDLKDNKNRTPLSYAAKHGHRDVVQLLLMQQIDIDSKDNNNRTPLSYAAEHGHRDVVQLLVERAADVNSKDESGRTPLSWAAKSGHEAVVQLFISNSCIDVDAKDNTGKTPLSYAVLGGHSKVSDQLYEKGASKENLYLFERLGKTKCRYWGRNGWVYIQQPLANPLAM